MSSLVDNNLPASGENYVVPIIVGDKQLGSDEHSEPVTSPDSSKIVHRYHSATAEDTSDAISAAQKALPLWRSTAPKQRRDIFLRAADIMETRRAELEGYMRTETAAPEPWVNFNLTTTIDLIRHAAALAFKANVGSAPVTDSPDSRGALVLAEPYGVVVGIAPWNAPYILGTRAALFPLAAGNTVILKGSELSPRCMWAIGSVLLEAGVPAGAINVLYSKPATAEAVTKQLVASPYVRKINFTGSERVGRLLGKLAGEYLKPLLLELGGKASAIVWSDANLDMAAQKCAVGAFFNAGQTCMATERVIVHRDVRAAFEEKLVAATKAIFGGVQDNSGDGAAVLIQPAAAKKVHGLVEDAIARGARVSGADTYTVPSLPGRVVPTIVTGITSDMDLYRTESFGPVVGIIEISTEDEALQIANDTEYGLSAAVFTEDLRRGLRMARGIQSGAVHINSMTVHDEMALPHGGIKSSGYGRFNVDLSEWTQTKTITYPIYIWNVDVRQQTNNGSRCEQSEPAEVEHTPAVNQLLRRGLFLGRVVDTGTGGTLGLADLGRSLGRSRPLDQLLVGREQDENGVGHDRKAQAGSEKRQLAGSSTKRAPGRNVNIAVGKRCGDSHGRVHDLAAIKHVLPLAQHELRGRLEEARDEICREAQVATRRRGAEDDGGGLGNANRRRRRDRRGVSVRHGENSCAVVVVKRDINVGVDVVFR
ncbi:salicylaldehyde dehydrogenase [Ophiostoma piceae UAMH 11346]|uniref:Salicylaldehyde dehydrogenase n=1 Tax=Ophiostoma piceae (strain UAMH 11346) TaxID=1262450 RepID=S3CIM3_OPHP1|nr:salicylaldehyde dehydrogenase [Ophiostoma piceae UAMH 11346]